MRGIMLVAKQRSGTNFLRGLLASAGALNNLGEVFQPAAGNGSMSKYDNWAAENDERPGTTYQDAIAHSQRYLESLEKPDFAPCIDVKYNSLFRTIGIWHSPADIPPIMMAAIRKNYVVVHLQRRNKIEHAVSTMAAQDSGVYVATESTKLDDDKMITIAPRSAIAVAEQYEREIQMFQYWIQRSKANFPNLVVKHVYYEDLNSANEEELKVLIGAILKPCNIPVTGKIESRTKKIIGNWRDKVLNADEIVEAFAERFGKDDGK